MHASETITSTCMHQAREHIAGHRQGKLFTNEMTHAGISSTIGGVGSALGGMGYNVGAAIGGLGGNIAGGIAGGTGAVLKGAGSLAMMPVKGAISGVGALGHGVLGKVRNSGGESKVRAEDEESTPEEGDELFRDAVEDGWQSESPSKLAHGGDERADGEAFPGLGLAGEEDDE